MLITKDKNKVSKTNSSQRDFEIFYERKMPLIENYKAFSNKEMGIGVGSEKPIDFFSYLEESKMGDIEKVKVALLLENLYRRYESMWVGKTPLHETSRADIPKFLKAGLGMIIANYAEDLTPKLFAQQVMPQREGVLFFLDIATDRRKGNIDQNFRIFDALRGFAGTDGYNQEKITGETIGASGSTDYTVTLEYPPVIPGSFELTDGSLVVRDDMNGNLVGDVGTPGGGFTNTINYVTGEVSVKLSSASTDTVKSSYSFNIEAASEFPGYGVQFRKTSVEARSHVQYTEWTHQSVIDAKNSLQVDLEAIIMDAGQKIMAAERFKKGVNHIRNRASGGEVIYNYTQPAGISNREHIDAFGILLARLQNAIWANTQKIRPNVIVFPTNMWFLFQFTPGFKAADMPINVDGMVGPKFAGTLTFHGIECICDPTMPPSEAILTYRGQEITTSSTFVADYIQFYKGPIHAKGFRKDFAMLSEYVFHTVNSDTMGRIKVTNL